MKKIQISIVITVVLLVSSSKSFSEASKSKTLVSVEDIGSKVTLVGRLGHPLGEFMKLRGIWKRPEHREKDNSPRFLVTHIDGKELKKPIEFNKRVVEAISTDKKNLIPDYEHEDELDGVSWYFDAYETGEFTTIPDGYRKQVGEPLNGTFGVPYWHRLFLTRLVGIVQDEDVSQQRPIFQRQR